MGWVRSGFITWVTSLAERETVRLQRGEWGGSALSHCATREPVMIEIPNETRWLVWRLGNLVVKSGRLAEEDEKEVEKAPVGQKKKTKEGFIVLYSPASSGDTGNSEWMSRRHGVCTYTMLTTAVAGVLTQTWCAWRRLQLRTRAAQRKGMSKEKDKYIIQ